MDVEWNESKNRTNRQKHKVDFADAHEVLGDIHLVFEDNRQNYGEVRYIAIGKLRGRMVVLVYTIRAGKYRIISMRKANEREQKAYEDRLKAAGQTT